MNPGHANPSRPLEKGDALLPCRQIRLHRLSGSKKDIPKCLFVLKSQNGDEWEWLKKAVHQPIAERLASLRQGDQLDAAILRITLALNQSALFEPVDQAGHVGVMTVEAARQRNHGCGLARLK